MALTLTREQAVSLLEALDFATASKWDEAKLQERIRSLMEEFDEEELKLRETATDADRETFRDVLGALDSEEEITVVAGVVRTGRCG